MSIAICVMAVQPIVPRFKMYLFPDGIGTSGFYAGCGMQDIAADIIDSNLP